MTSAFNRMTSAFNSSFEVHTPNMKESSFLMQKNKISTVPINGQVGVKGQTDKEHLCNIRTWFLRNGTGGGEQDHTVFQTFGYETTWYGLCFRDLPVFKHEGQI